jgi:hypothetical protein
MTTPSATSTAPATKTALPSVILATTARTTTANGWTITTASAAIGKFGKAVMAEWFARKAEGRVAHLAAGRLRRTTANYLRGAATDADLLVAEAVLSESQAWAGSLARVMKGLDLTKVVGNRADGSGITLDTVASMVFAPETGAQAEKACREAIG